ncbi:MAG TPA: cupin domain-containing protein [Candidatus Synoicihabitans sp.]|nr:cupin domain-containing protein [Candidatus Synoicihabitans sp.]
MRRVHLDQVPWLEWSSPNKTFHGTGQQISEALGAVTNAPLHAGGHPFDLERGRLLPGKSGCPFHSHSAQWELFVILQGTGMVRFGKQRRDVTAGDVILYPPGAPHQLVNTGATALEYYLITDNPLTEFWQYPDSNKWGHRPGGACFRRQEVNYWLDEESDAPAEEPAVASPEPSPPDAHARFVSIGSIPWEHRMSPKGRYSSRCRDISLALGGVRNAGLSAGGHPFDLQIRRVPPGAAICPFHSHAAQWELFVFREGRGVVRSGDERLKVGPGDVVLHPPGVPHQTMAHPDAELECWIIADNPPVDVFHYPESNKWGLRPPGKYFRMTEVDYFDGEE